MIGWLLDTNIAAEIIRAGGSFRVKAWAAAQDEGTVDVSVLTIAESDMGIANLPDGNPRRVVYVNTPDSLVGRFESRLLPVADEVARRWGVISGSVRRDTGHLAPLLDTMLAATALKHGLYSPPGIFPTCVTATPRSSTYGTMMQRPSQFSPNRDAVAHPEADDPLAGADRHAFDRHCGRTRPDAQPHAGRTQAQRLSREFPPRSSAWNGSGVTGRATRSSIRLPAAALIEGGRPQPKGSRSLHRRSSR